MSELVRVSRQTMAYLQGISCLDERRLRRALEGAVRSAEKFLNTD